MQLTKRGRSRGNNLSLEGGVLLQVLAVFTVDGAGHNGAQHMVHLPDSRVSRALEEHQALLQQAAVPHFRSNQVRLVAIRLLHNPLHIGWVQDLHQLHPCWCRRQPGWMQNNTVPTAVLEKADTTVCLIGPQAIYQESESYQRKWVPTRPAGT